VGFAFRVGGGEGRGRPPPRGGPFALEPDQAASFLLQIVQFGAVVGAPEIGVDAPPSFRRSVGLKLLISALRRLRLKGGRWKIMNAFSSGVSCANNSATDRG
jgi:hypothetical protein